MNQIPSHQSQWLYWFDKLASDEAIRRAAHRSVIPIDGLGLMSVENACQRLEGAWREVFVPGPQHVEILRMFVNQARGFSATQYPTLKDYNRQRGGEVQVAVEIPPIRCLTGLAGGTKSSLMKAFERICQVGPTQQFVADGEQLSLYPVRRIQIQAHLSVGAVLKSVANPLAVAGKSMPDLSALLLHVRDWFLATGTATVVMDEMQFFTQSSTASTKTAQLIMIFASLGIPLAYVANYSLVNKLLQRPQEEKDRLLAYPIVLEPPTADAPWWRQAICEYAAVSTQHFRLDAEVHAHELHRLTGGLFRALRQLLLQAYRVAVELGHPFVTMEEVRLAYRSGQFSSHRRDVEDLASLAVSSLIAERRPDLVCPLAPVRGATLKVTSSDRATSPVARIDPPMAMLESTVSLGAQQTLKTLRQAANRPPEQRIDATVTRLPRRIPVSAQSLHDGAQLLKQALLKTAPATKNKAVPVLDPLEDKGHGHAS